MRQVVSHHSTSAGAVAKKSTMDAMRANLASTSLNICDGCHTPSRNSQLGRSLLAWKSASVGFVYCLSRFNLTKTRVLNVRINHR